MKNRKDRMKGKKVQCPYDLFNLGDRVKRIYTDELGNMKEYRGMILAIDNNSIEVYWDTLDGRYRPQNMDVAFTTCKLDEIFKGKENYSPIEKEG